MKSCSEIAYDHLNTRCDLKEGPHTTIIVAANEEDAKTVLKEIAANKLVTWPGTSKIFVVLRVSVDYKYEAVELEGEELKYTGTIFKF